MDPRVPPQNLDMEMALIGAVFANADVLDEVLATIPGPEVFYVPAHRTIFAAVLRRRAAEEPIDLLSLSADLQAREALESIGGHDYLILLADSVCDCTKAAYYAQEVLKVHKCRSLIRIADTLLERAYSPLCDPDSTASEYAKQIEAVATQATGKEVEDVRVIIDRTFEELADGNTQAGHLATGMTRFDTVLGGLPRGCMTILAACTSVGKTSLALQLSLQAAADGVPVLFFTIEMSRRLIGNRLVSMTSGKPLRELEDYQSLNGTLQLAREHIETDRIYVTDCTEDIGRIVALSRMYIRTYGVGLIVVDYLQKCGTAGRFNSTNDRVTEMSKVLHRMATTTGAALLVLSQFSRDVAKQKREPQLSDLRDSGSIEQDGDLILLMSAKQESAYDDQNPERDVLLHAAKNRHGPTGRFQLVFHKASMTFRSEHVGAVM